MAATPGPEPSSAAAELWRRRGRLLTLGGMLMLMGAVTVSAATTSITFSVPALGAVLMVAGSLEAAYAFRFWRSRWASFVPALLAGVLYLVGGMLMAAGPRLTAAGGINLLLASVLIASGVLRLLWSIGSKTPGGAASTAHGTITLALGILLWAAWPSAAPRIAGAFVGFDLLASGGMLLYMAWTARGLAPRDVGRDPDGLAVAREVRKVDPRDGLPPSP